MSDQAGAPATVESTLSNWVGPYVTDMMGRADALSTQPYTAYTGPLTAGQSDLQTTGFTGLDALWSDRNNTFDPTMFTSDMSYNPAAYSSETGFGYTPYGDTGIYAADSWLNPGVSESYMSPYITGALDPQLDEIRRQAEIERVNNASRMTSAGTFGGSRQAIMESELDDNMLRLMSEIYGTGMQDAYESGRSQFNTEEDNRRDQYNIDTDRGIDQFNREQDFQAALERDYRDQFNIDEDRRMQNYQDQVERDRIQHNFEQGLQFDTSEANRQYGLDLINDIMRGGAVQRDIDSEGIAADIAQFENERDYPYRMVQFMQSMLQGLPVGTSEQSYYGSSPYNNTIAEIGYLYDFINEILNGGGEGDD